MKSHSKQLIKVGDKLFAKTLAFGNRKQQTIQVSQKTYRRNPKHKNQYIPH